jgi:hypothetical protein
MEWEEVIRHQWQRIRVRPVLEIRAKTARFGALSARAWHGVPLKRQATDKSARFGIRERRESVRGRRDQKRQLSAEPRPCRSTRKSPRR